MHIHFTQLEHMLAVGIISIDDFNKQRTRKEAPE
jgi:hypothetical protein